MVFDGVIGLGSVTVDFNSKVRDRVCQVDAVYLRDVFMSSLSVILCVLSQFTITPNLYGNTSCSKVTFACAYDRIPRFRLSRQRRPISFPIQPFVSRVSYILLARPNSIKQ